MKLIFMCLALIYTFQAKASFIDDLKKAADLINSLQEGSNNPQYITPGQRPPRYPEPGHNPGYNGGTTCVAKDNGWEEHSGGHFNCNECLRDHERCTETCSSQVTECQAEGLDRYGRQIRFDGRGDSQWRAEDDAMYRCQYNAGNCHIINCQQRNNLVSQRDCRR